MITRLLFTAFFLLQATHYYDQYSHDCLRHDTRRYPLLHFHGLHTKLAHAPSSTHTHSGDTTRGKPSLAGFHNPHAGLKLLASDPTPSHHHHHHLHTENTDASGRTNFGGVPQRRVSLRRSAVNRQVWRESGMDLSHGCRVGKQIWEKDSKTPRQKWEPNPGPLLLTPKAGSCFLSVFCPLASFGVWSPTDRPTGRAEASTLRHLTEASSARSSTLAPSTPTPHFFFYTEASYTCAKHSATGAFIIIHPSIATLEFYLDTPPWSMEM